MRAIQAAVFWSRWLLAPFLVGLACCLLLLIVRFFEDFYGLAVKVQSLTWHDLVVDVLNLLDVALTANLILIVIFSTYENFIHKVGPDEQSDLPEGLVNVGFGELKQKLLGSIAVIAAVDALAWYLDLEKTADVAKLGWAIAFPLMFGLALLLLALADWLGRHAGGKPE
jgi:uncharacterized protein (TIGR00645 family)